MKTRDQAQTGNASDLIDQRIGDLDDWRGETLGKIRALIREVDPEVVEEWKWRGTPVWSHGGILFTGETYKAVVKLTFAKGASLPDPKKLFNASLDGNMRRAIDIKQGEKLDTAALKALFRAAIARNEDGKKKGSTQKAVAKKAPAKKKAVAKKATAKKKR